MDTSLAALYPKARPRARGVRYLAPLYRAIYALRGALLHPPHATVRERIGGLTLVVTPGVFNPAAFLTSPLLCEAIRPLMPAKPGTRWLELGTGCGLGALFSAKHCARVIATDINPLALQCARDNAERLKLLDRIEFREGDLFAPVPGERFDVILFHPPYFPGAQDSTFAQAWRYGDLPGRFARELAAHLRPGGCALLLLSSNGDCASYLRALQAEGFTFDIVVEREFYVERAFVYRATLDVPHEVEGART